MSLVSWVLVYLIIPGPTTLERHEKSMLHIRQVNVCWQIAFGEHLPRIWMNVAKIVKYRFCLGQNDIIRYIKLLTEK